MVAGVIADCYRAGVVRAVPGRKFVFGPAWFCVNEHRKYALGIMCSGGILTQFEIENTVRILRVITHKEHQNVNPDSIPPRPT